MKKHLIQEAKRWRDHSPGYAIGRLLATRNPRDTVQEITEAVYAVRRTDLAGAAS